MKNIKVMALFHALGVGIYVTGIVYLVDHVEKIFDNGLLTPIFMLLLFVLSATITGSLVIGKPILLYIEKKKREAVEMFFYTVGWLVIILMLVVILRALTF